MSCSKSVDNLPEPRVLSIQSHVVHGYVGNKSATFPLQVLGFEVDGINSVQFSNHTGYNIVKGQIITETELADLVYGLETNDLLKYYTHLLTGYIGDPSFLRLVAEVAKKMRIANPNLIFVCDPVMGDNGHMYVSEDLLPIYKNEILPLADIITPNQFEAELLTEIKINSESNVRKAIDIFHKMGIDTVVISSTDFFDKYEQLKSFVSKQNGPCYSLNIPKQGPNITFTGTGDLFAALFLAHSYRLSTSQLNKALEYTVATLQTVIQQTLSQMPNDVFNGEQKATCNQRELKIIQCKHAIENPKVILKAQQVD